MPPPDARHRPLAPATFRACNTTEDYPMNDNIGFDAGPPAKSNAPTGPKPPTRQEVIDWLAYQTEALVRRRDSEVLPAIAAMVKAHPTIPDGDEDLAGRFAVNITMEEDTNDEEA